MRLILREKPETRESLSVRILGGGGREWGGGSSDDIGHGESRLPRAKHSWGLGWIRVTLRRFSNWNFNYIFGTENEMM